MEEKDKYSLLVGQFEHALANGEEIQLTWDPIYGFSIEGSGCCSDENPDLADALASFLDDRMLTDSL